MNYLCRLPDELLGSIFDLAQSPNRRILLPYSKRLLPFLRYYLYHRVRISSYHSLNLFCSSTQSNPLLLNLVSSLKIRIEFVPGRGPAREARDVGVPSNRTLINVLSDSFEVEEISIYGSTRIAFMLLVSDVMSQALPQTFFAQPHLDILSHRQPLASLPLHETFTFTTLATSSHCRPYPREHRPQYSCRRHNPNFSDFDLRSLPRRSNSSLERPRSPLTLIPPSYFPFHRRYELRTMRTHRGLHRDHVVVDRLRSSFALTERRVRMHSRMASILSRHRLFRGVILILPVPPRSCH